MSSRQNSFELSSHANQIFVWNAEAQHLAALLDKNHDGKLSPAELRTALADSGIDISEVTLEELMQDMPSNKTGQDAGEPELTKDTFAVRPPCFGHNYTILCP